MRTTFRRKRYAGRRRDEDEARILITGVVQRIEPSLDERVVKRAYRDEALAEKRMRKPERGEQDEQVHLGDAELEMLPLGREIPGEGGRDAFRLEQILHVLAREKAAPIDEGTEIGRDGHVG